MSAADLHPIPVLSLEWPRGPATDDALFPHPVYGTLGWLSVVNPGPATSDPLRDLLRSAHQAARGRRERRAGTRSS